MQLLPVLFLSIAMLLRSGASVAEDRYECVIRCSSEKETLNMDCPSPYDSANSGQDRSRCLENNQAAFLACFNRCPPSQLDSSSSSEWTAPVVQLRY